MHERPTHDAVGDMQIELARRAEFDRRADNDRRVELARREEYDK